MLRSLAPNAKARAHLIGEVSEEADRRLADVMWELLANPTVTVREAGSLQRGLMLAYLGQQYYAPRQVAASDRRELAKAAKPRASGGRQLAAPRSDDAFGNRRPGRSGRGGHEIGRRRET